MAQLKDLIVSGAARILGKLYASEFVGKLTGNADTATKATQDSGGQQINTTYIKGLSVSGKTITYTKGNGTTGTITTQDTVYAHPTYTARSAGFYKVTVDGSGHVSNATAVAKSDITALGIPGTNTTYSTFTKATSDAAGGSGLVPAPAKGQQGLYLRGDGTWATPTNTTYSAATTSTSGLMTADMVTKLNGIATGANAYSHPTYTAKSSGLYKVTVDGTGHVSATAAVTKADITALGIPGSDTNTDTKMTQTAVTSTDYTNWRTVLWGASNSGTEGFSPTTVTDGAFSDKNLTYQPSTGTLRATTFKGNLAWSNITGKPSTYTPASHTHNYAGSSSAGGAATSANKLNTNAGSATQPVYFSNGVPVACTYTLGKSVPSNAVFTDTNTWRGIQNNLTSDSTSDSLSAAQGKVLNNGKMGAISANGYYGMARPDGNTSDWIRTTSNGIIPYQSGGAGAGHCGIGTSSWYFSTAYIDAIRCSNISSTGWISSNQSLAVEKSDANEAVVKVQNSLRNGKFIVSTTGRLGIYDTTNGAWMLCSEPKGDGIWTGSNIKVSKSNLAESNVEVINSSCDVRLAAAASEKAGIYDVKSEKWIMYVYKSYGKANFDNRVQMTGIYDNTSSNAANVRIASDGDLMRSTSASKYKLNIQDINRPDSYYYNILKLKPKQWFDKAEIENYSKYLTDLYNDKLDREKIDYREDTLMVNPIYGLIAEDVEAAGLSEFCDYSKIDEDGNKEIEGIQYDRLPVLMIPILRDLVTCMQKILPSVEENISDKSLLSEIKDIQSRFNSFNPQNVINKSYSN